MTNLMIKNDSFIQSMHNNIQCLSLDMAVRPCDRCWFTSKQIQDWADMNKDTLNRKLEKLVKVGRIVGLQDTTNNIIDIDKNNGNVESKPLSSNLSLVENSINSDIIELNLQHETGSKITKLYNLNVLNHLAMVELDNEKLNTIANKFSDILSEVETTGSYGLQIDKHDLLLLNISKAKTPEERALAISELEQYHAEQKKALEDKNEQLEVENEILTQQRDKAIATKHQISTNREAVAIGRVGGLVTANNRLKDELYGNRNRRTIKAVAIANHLKDKDINHYKLIKYCKEHDLEIIKVPDTNWNEVNSYPIEAFKAIYPELIID